MTKFLQDIKNDNFEVRLTESEDEIIASQKLRYKVFFEEDGATPSEQVLKEKRDFDEFDEYCEHLIVIDRNAGDNPENYVIGSYRLLRQENQKKLGKWFSESEFNVEKFNNYDGEVLELGRVCVHKNYRNKIVMQMLWNGLAAYMFDYDIKLMFGCGSFIGTDVLAYRNTLSYLQKNFVATGDLEIEAKTENKCEYPTPDAEISDMEAFKQLPTMIKAYIRVGCKVSKSIYIDKIFNTFDVCIIFETKNLKKSYLEHYTKRIKSN